jgi:hypothetical protein
MPAPTAQYNEKRARFDALPSPEVNSAEVGAIERGAGFAQRIIKWLEDKNVFGTYKNDETGWNIILNKTSVKNVIFHAARNGKVALLGMIPQLINNGIYLETNPINEKGLISHIFASKATIDKEPYAVTYVVREDKDGKRYYDHFLITVTALDQIKDQVPSYVHQQELSRVTVITITGRRKSQLAKPLLPNILKKHLAVNTQDENYSS